MATRKASLASLVRKVDQLTERVDRLAEDVKADRAATTEQGRRLSLLNLNGSAAALHKLAEKSDSLLRLAEVAPYITTAVEQRKEQEIVRAWFKRNLNPIASRIGAIFWAIVVSVAALVIANRIH